jgi:hypothetical protein
MLCTLKQLNASCLLAATALGGFASVKTLTERNKMIEEIVKRLRRIVEQQQCDCDICDTSAEAAKEIERLRSALHQQNEYSLRLQNELERIRG